MRTKNFIGIFVSLFLLSSRLALSAQLSESLKFTITNRYNVGGEGGWDLITLDTKHHHLFISRSSHVQVMDTDSGRVVDDIPNTDGVHGIALAVDLNLGFTSNGKSNSVTVFDLTTLNVLETIKISGLNPDAILYEPISKHIFDRLNVLPKLKAFAVSTKHLGSVKKNHGDYYLLTLEIDKSNIQIRRFPEGEFNRASEQYSELEKTLELNPDRDVVLISAESIHALKKAYPNYFADTSDFSRNLEKILKVNKNLLQSK